ncbi:MAG: ABC transporter permease [Anaerolineaceae bacterium]|nr:ABC transporter permease [Anaerolineaceae bacterium]
MQPQLSSGSSGKASHSKINKTSLSRDLRFVWERSKKFLTPLVAIALALGIGAVLMYLNGYSPLRAYSTLWWGAFGNLRNISEVLVKATPLMFTGLAMAVAFRASIWNMGAEGQFFVGAIATTWVGIHLGYLPPWILIPLEMAAGIMAGALAGMLAGYLKVRFNANEVVTTIMINYLIIIGTNYLVTGPMKEVTQDSFPQSALISANAFLPRIVPTTRLNIGFLIAIVLSIIMYLLIFKTSFGYALRATGINPEAARFARMDTKKIALLVMALSGGLAGLGGSIEIAGLAHRLFSNVSPGYGWDGIAVSLLVNNNPLGVMFSGILFGALRSGSEIMQINAGIPSVLNSAIQGIVILSVIAFGAYRFISNKKEGKE